MSRRASQPGKTAPKFLHDLLRLDPQSVHSNRNILVDNPPQFDGDARTGPPLVLDRGSCKHEYYSHLERCNLPRIDEAAQQDTRWKVAASCRKCRLYLTLILDYPDTGCRQPCPNRDYPLHHLRHQSTDSSQVGYHFECSNIACQAHVHVAYEQPVLSKADILLLTDPQALSRRHESILESTPDRAGVKLANPLDVFTRLKRYVSDSLITSNARRSFPARNKKFMEAFGTDCDAILYSLGFTRGEDTEGEDQWKLPSPKSFDDPDPLRHTLEKLIVEVQYLIDDYCASHATPNPSRPTYQDAKLDLARTLSAQAYDKVPGRNLASGEEDHPYYASLGALGDFSDRLIAFCYDRQAASDPSEGPYYFDCLHDLATNRGSELLIMKSSTLASQEVLSKKDINQAYKALGVDQDSQHTISDEHIIGIYRSRWSDTGPQGQADLKLALKTLGHARKSRSLIDAAADIALYGVKVNDDPSTKDLARQAIELIAAHRKSEMLQSWLATGEMTPAAMSLEDALKHFEIENLDGVDPEVLEVVFGMAPDGPVKDRAVSTIRKAMEDRKPSTETWPVGLISHGNTCYLNSLLQYYFTIKPLRELVLDFDKYKYDLTTQGAKEERVGNLHRPVYEIESFQSLTNDLRHLFERMIKDRGPAVRPEANLVCRAFLKPSNPEADTTGSQKDEAVDVNMTSTESESHPTGVATSGNVEELTTVSQASSTTLQDDAVLTPPATPKAEKEGELLAPPLPPRRPETPSQQTRTNLEKAEEAARQQQDVAEVMEELLTRLRASIKPLGQDAQGEQLDQLRDIFNMRIMDTIIPEDEQASTKEDDFTNLMLLPPYEPTDIYSALDRVLDLHLEPEASKPVNVYKTLKSFPPILQISINRIRLGRDGKPVKSVDRIRLEETLYMDRYSEDDAILARRKQCWEWRRRLRGLQAEKEIIQKTEVGIDGPSALDGVGEWLATLPEVDALLAEVGVDPLNVPESLASDLQQESILQRARLTVIDKEVRELEGNIAKQFSGPDFERLKYRLHAVFFHRGSTGHGHYWTYIYDIQNNMWLLYNDEKVEQFDKLNDILNADSWMQGTPTYAVYVRDDTKEQFVQPLCRDVEEVSDEPMPDAPMLSEPISSEPNYTALPEADRIQEVGDWNKVEAPQNTVNW
ncbi:cysteine proteinase [Aureobasidium subglaciale]|nr:cysteine proteinase [Aureobasidium subglaciale]